MKLATTFDADQLEGFEQMQVSKVEMIAIARIRDDGDRNKVINSIASGTVPAGAIASVAKPDDGVVKPVNGHQVAKRAAATAKAESAWPTEQDTDDATRLATYCGKIRNFLPEEGRARFDNDATFYRAFRDIRNTARTTGKKLVEAQRTRARGACLRAAIRLLYVKHPSEWLRCGKCRGHGQVNLARRGVVRPDSDGQRWAYVASSRKSPAGGWGGATFPGRGFGLRASSPRKNPPPHETLGRCSLA